MFTIDELTYTGEHLSRVRLALSEKYELDYDPCPQEGLIDWIYGCGGREMELFTEGEKNSFSIVYRNGSIVLSIFLYNEKICSHFSDVSGGIIPENNSHLVIDNPESVNLVNPPIIIVNATSEVINNNHLIILVFLFSSDTKLIYISILLNENYYLSP